MKPIKAESWSGGRLASIDALRGIAALGVVLYHTALRTPEAVPSNILKWPGLVMQTLASYGYVGVFLFFVISGFCIHLQWARARAAGEPRQIRFGAFWRRRIRRLYPPYLIALALYLGLTWTTTGIKVTHFFIYDVVMHLLMLHNLDPKTCYSINSVFWTLAIEEQLYLAYFLLLFLRTRWGWGPTLIVCAAVRVGWFFFSHGVWVASGFGLPVPEAAASHWLTWALGAISVEAAFGLIKLPRWCRNLWLAAGSLLLAVGVSQVFPVTDKDGFIHQFCWLVLHPAWGLGFFIIVNRAFEAEKRWRAALRTPLIVAMFAALGVFSYSLYLTHELAIMESWRLGTSSLPLQLNALLVVTPATIVFAWLFFQFCEKPYMRKPPTRIARAPEKSDRMKSEPEIRETPEPVFAQTVASLVED